MLLPFFVVPFCLFYILKPYISLSIIKNLIKVKNMTYNIKLDEREFSLILEALSTNEWFDTMNPVPSKYDDDVVNLDFEKLLEYGNAYLIKCLGLDEDKDYQKLNVYAHIEQTEKNENWLDDYDKIDTFSIRKKQEK